MIMDIYIHTMFLQNQTCFFFQMDHEGEEIEIPSYFICPISLDIMKDPVIAISGITYDRESIFKWLEKVPSCPVTKQPLPPSGSDLTPNHTLRRLIQHWCVENATRGVVRIPTPRVPPGKPNVVEEIKNLTKFGDEALAKEDTLKKLEVLAMEGETNRRTMHEGGVHRSLILFVVKCTREQEEEGQRRIKGQLDESLRLLHLIGVPLNDARTILMENDRILESLSLVLNRKNFLNKAYTIVLLRNLTENTSSHIVERLNPEILKGIIGFLKEVSSFNQKSPNVSDTAQSSNRGVRNKAPSKLDYSLVIKKAVTAALMILLDTSSWSRNRTTLVDLGAVSQLIELEISSTGENRATELVLGVLSRLCCCADGRAEILAHRGGIAVVTKRLLGVSIAADDRALSILSTVSKFSREKEVVEEMVCVGTVEKLCTVLRVDCALNLKEKAKEILEDHFDEWKKFPCIDVTLLTKLLSSSHEDLLAEFYSTVIV